MIVSGLYQTYILVHIGTSLWHECTYFDQLVTIASAPGWPAWKQWICCFGKTHQFIHTHTQLFKFGSDYFLRLPVGAGRKCRQWAGPLPTLHCQILCPSGISAMLHWCSRLWSSFCFHLVSRVRTPIVGPAWQYASICQMRYGFSQQQTSKSTTWKYTITWPKNIANKSSWSWQKKSSHC